MNINPNNQPNYAEYRDFSDTQDCDTECASENEENCILSNNEYKIEKIPSRLKQDNDDDSSVPRILYDKKNKKYCYQLDYNTFIFLSDSEYKNNKYLFEIKDKRLLFFKESHNGTVIGRGELNDEGDRNFEKYKNINEYIKKYGNLDKNGEFKKNSDEMQEIKIYKNTDEYLKRKCYLYKNMDDFKKNIYTIYLDIYDYYFPDYIKQKIKKYEKLLPSGYEKRLNITNKNINTYKKRYNIFYNENDDLIKLNDKNNKLISIKDIKEEDIKDYEKAEQFLGKYFSKWTIPEDKALKDKEKFEYGSICGTIDSIADEIEYLTKFEKILYSIKEDINLILNYNDLKNTHNYGKENIKKLKQIKEKAEALISVFSEPLIKSHKILIDYIKLYGKIITNPIFFQLDNSEEIDLKKLNDKISKYIETKIITSENPLYARERRKYTFNFPNYKENEYLEDLLFDNINWNNEIRKKFFWELKDIKEKIDDVSSYIEKYKKIFRPENKLNLKENINEKSEIKDKKMLNLFMCYMYDIIEYLYNFKKNRKDFENNKTFPECSTVMNEEIMKKLSNYILEKTEKTSIAKEDEEIILKDLEKILNLYVNLFLKDKEVIPNCENLEEYKNAERYFKDFNRDLNPNGSYIFTPFIKELLFNLLNHTKKYIGQDKKSSYKSLYNLCKTLETKVKKPKIIFLRDLCEYHKDKSGDYISSEDSDSSESSISDNEITINTDQKIKNFQEKIKKHKEYIENFFKNSYAYYNNKKYFSTPLEEVCKHTLPDIEKYKDFIKKFKNYEKINLFEEEVKSLEALLFKNIERITITGEDLYNKKFDDKLSNNILDLYKSEDADTVTVKQNLEKLNNYKNEYKQKIFKAKKEKEIKTTVKIFKDEINEHKEYIENIYKYENKQEFLDKINHLSDNIVPVINQYEEFIKKHKDFNEEIKQFENEVNLFKIILIKNLENIIKEVKENFKEENLIIEKLKETLKNLISINSDNIKNVEKKENLNKIIEEQPKEQSKTKELDSKKFKEDLNKINKNNEDLKNILKTKKGEFNNINISSTNKDEKENLNKIIEEQPKEQSKTKELDSKKFKEDLNKINKNNEDLKNILKTKKGEFNNINISSTNKDEIKKTK